MKRRSWIYALTVSVFPLMADESEPVKLAIVLDPVNPEKSLATLTNGKFFQVGFGRDGYLAPGSTFVGGFSLLGEFQVNAIFSRDRFEMTDELVAESGKSRAWLAENLFTNMSSIDFDEDGKGGEYGEAFIGLAPLDLSVKQPFHFGNYKGVFRWYSYAIHGTQNEARIGKCITGGCINMGAEALRDLLSDLAIGDRVRVGEAS